MEKFFVITNEQKDDGCETTCKIKRYLEEKGKQCVLSSESSERNLVACNYTSEEMVPAGTECIIVLGGDGTLIQAARDLNSLHIPFIGVNLGKLGYMAEVEKNQIIPTLDKLIANQYEVEERMMLIGRIYRNGKLFHENLALNDIVISCKGIRIMDFEVFVNQKSLYHYIADGMIVSTPTGSTAYNLSAGGPIVEPGANLIVMTPICAHTLNTRSIVLSSEDTISIAIGNERNPEEEKLVGYDGYDVVKLSAGDVVEIEKSTITTKIIKISDISFLEILKMKMGDI